VLVVEDNLSVPAMIRQHFRLEGFPVVDASDAKEEWPATPQGAPRCRLMVRKADILAVHPIDAGDSNRMAPRPPSG
jgi:DNA-binding response OmpR family regulator